MSPRAREGPPDATTTAPISFVRQDERNGDAVEVPTTLDPVAFLRKHLEEGGDSDLESRRRRQH